MTTRKFISFKKGFSLVETAVVLGIVCVLVALLVPVAIKTIEATKSALCLANLRQLGVAAMAYSSENDGCLVPSSIAPASGTTPIRWRALLLPYLPSNDMRVFVCPSSLDVKFIAQNPPSWRVSTGLQPCSYDINSYSGGTLTPGMHDVSTSTNNKHFRYASVPNPSRNIFLFDTGLPADISLPYSEWTEPRGPLGSCFWSVMPNQWSSRQWGLYPRHNKGKFCNSLFYDGHAASIDVASELVACPPGNGGCIYDFQGYFR